VSPTDAAAFDRALDGQYARWRADQARKAVKRQQHQHWLEQGFERRIRRCVTASCVLRIRREEQRSLIEDERRSQQLD
jgi:primosomal protein N''